MKVIDSQSQKICNDARAIGEFMGVKIISLPDFGVTIISEYEKENASAIWQNYTHWHNSWEWFMRAYKEMSDLLQALGKQKAPHSITRLEVMEVDVHCAVREFDLFKSFTYLADMCRYIKEKQIKLLPEA